MKRERLLAWSALLLLACSKDGTGPTLGPSGIRVIAGAGVTDTILSIQKQALIVEVRDTTGALAQAGIIVRFTAPPSYIGPSYVGSETWVAPLDKTGFSSFATTTTNGAGRASVLIQLGRKAGPARLAIDVPEFGTTDTARFVVTPGNAAKIVVTPLDTAALVGETISFAGRVQDGVGNTRSGDVISWSVSSSSATVSATGSLSAAEVGRYTLTAQYGPFTGIVMASVVPRARMVSFTASYPRSMVLSDLDGRNRRSLTTAEDGGIGFHPNWMPDHSGVVYTSVVGGLQTIQIVDTLGLVRRFFPSGIPFVTHMADPTPTADGQWLYFSAWDSRCAAAYCLYRSRIDGTNPELLGTSAMASSELHPSPSPDGSQIAYQAGLSIRIFSVGTQQVSSWSITGVRPVWSPDGSRIAFITLGYRIGLIAPGGSAPVTLGPIAVFDVSWSPDGKYLIASDGATIHLVDAQSGADLPIPLALVALPIIRDM